jgi:hypothetical protein
MQTLQLLKLNTARFLKGWSKIGCFLVLAATVGFYFLYGLHQPFKPEPPRSMRMSGVKLFSSSNDAAYFTGNTEGINVTVSTKDSFQSNTDSYYSGYYIQIHSVEAGNISYTLSSAASRSHNFFARLFDDKFKIAHYKQKIDSILSKTPSKITEVNIEDRRYITFRSLYLDFFPLAVCSVLLTWLVEEKTSGMKFYLKMTGLKSSTYYFGTLGVHIILLAIYSVLVIVLHQTYLPIASAAPISILVFSTSFGYLGLTWILAHFVSATNVGYTLLTIYVSASYAAGFLGEILVQNVPKWGLLMLGVVFNQVNYSVFLYQQSFKFEDTGFSSNSYPPECPTGILHLM